MFLHRVPKPPLDAFIELIWVCRREPAPHRLERVLPNGAAQLFVNLKEDQTRTYEIDNGHLRVTVLPGTVVSGVHSRYAVIDTAEQESVAGAVFRPGGTAPFFRLPAHEMREADVAVEDLWGRGAVAAMRERLLEARTPDDQLDVLERVLAAMQRWPGGGPVIEFAVQELARPAGISEIAAASGLSQKRFIERFKSAVGVAPKQYSRILRFQRALATAEKGRLVDWTRVAVDCGYFDQAHFIHDFRSFAGIAPNMYRAGRTEFRNHVKFLQSDGGAAVALSAHG